MATSLTFAQLQANLQAYLERGGVNDTVVNAQLPYLINQAERRCARELKVLGFIQSVQGVMTPGSWVVSKPDRWRQTVSINYGSGAGFSGQANTLWQPIFPRSLEYVRNYNQDVTLLGPPKFYADYNFLNWCFGPTPDQAYPFEVVYYELPALLDATNNTNWLSQFAPNLLLYAALWETELFLKNDDRAATWKDLYGREMAAMNGEDMQKIVDRQVLRQDA